MNSYSIALPLASHLLKKYGSPLYVYDEQILLQKIARLKSICSDMRVYYALKANPNKALVSLINQQGIKYVDAVSPGQIHKALLCGYPPQNILFTENFSSGEQIRYAVRNKQGTHKEQIRYAVEKGVTLNIGALSTLQTNACLLRETNIFIRINPKMGAGETEHVITGGPRSKFGIVEEDIEKVKQICLLNKINIIGIHQHIGSNLKKKDEGIFLQTTRYTLQITRLFQSVKYINIGGGIGVKYRANQQISDPEQLFQEVRKIKEEINPKLTICIEPGRFIICQCGVLLCTITGKKKTKQCVFYGVDSGFNHLIRPTLYGSHHEIVNVSRPMAEKQTKVTVCGNICESGDKFAVDISFGGEVGDIVAIQNTGAYGFSMSSNYNERCKPAEILIRNGEDIVIRRRQIFQDLQDKL